MKGKDTNLDIMPPRKKNKGPNKKTTLSKSQKRKLNKLEEEKEKEILSTTELLGYDCTSLHFPNSSSYLLYVFLQQLEKRRRPIQLSKAGVVSEHSDEPVMDNDSCMDEPTTLEPAVNVDIPSLQTDSEKFVNANELDFKVTIPAEEIYEEDKHAVDMNLLTSAGFGSKQFSSRSVVISITQSHRVAVLATAKRIAHELGVRLGQAVGFQVGENATIKSMTEGVLLREIQNDFLLRRYSVIILDEAHERSLNTDILIGMLYSESSKST
ncbi:unnamed protein product [Eruca vesicaria subsp. sativa]|uniref:RNA helicase n=1 Tax=Eruca vesicaria subsp. sativa TaxID=29727 RepID=A0ABC8K302_ERUVS|nr:unnamed protein product [Eruca vesicaria subsp. sativa]